MGHIFELFFIIKVLTFVERGTWMGLYIRQGSNATSDIYFIKKMDQLTTYIFIKI
jgi:hypothetical protein